MRLKQTNVFMLLLLFGIACCGALAYIETDDPVLQRVMVAVPVNPDRIEGVNSTGARAFLDYLLQPETKSKIAAFRAPGCQAQLWRPAARHN